MGASSIVLASASLRVELVRHGAELVSLREVSGEELLWQAGPQWRRHAPVLFPIIGRVPADTIHHLGRDYPLSQHGFARDLEFELLDAQDGSARLQLESDERTLARFPFRFALNIEYAVEGRTLRITQTVGNTDEVPWAASLGNHPAFAYPLPGAEGRPHAVLFDGPEPEGFARAPENLILPERHPVPFDPSRPGAVPVDDAFFADGVMIFAQPRRRVVRYAALGEGGAALPGVPTVTVDTGDFDVMGMWKPVGAPFLCLEPWRSIPTPAGWDGDILDKPGQFRLEPGETAAFSYSVTVGE